MVYILIHTDGYDINCVDSYKDFEKAQKAMEQQYKDYMPSDGLSPE